jgi:hypothetical protein
MAPKDKESTMTTFLTSLTLVVATLFARTIFATETPDWDKTFKPSDQVIHEKVEFRDRRGISISSDR